MNTETNSTPSNSAQVKTNGLQSEQMLMQKICQRDQSALASLYERFGNAVYSLALHVLQDQISAEEVTQDVFLKIWERADQWDSKRGKLATWILAMTRNAAIDRLRKENRTVDFTSAPLDKVVNLLAVEDWQQGQQLRILLQQIPPEQAQIVQLSFFGGLSHTDMADMLDIPLGTIKTRLRLGLQKLRDLWLEKKA